MTVDWRQRGAVAKPLMKQVDDRRRAQHITLATAAVQLGTYMPTLSNWSSGRNSPLFHSAVAYADLVSTRIVLPYRGRILAEGLDIVEALPELRRFVGATHRVMGERVGLHRKTIQNFEAWSGPRYLVSVETYAAGLCLSLAVLPVELAVAS